MINLNIKIIFNKNDFKIWVLFGDFLFQRIILFTDRLTRSSVA